MHEGRLSTGLIGPNSVLQLLPVVERHGGPELVEHLMGRARIAGLPDGSKMIPEDEAARLHRTLRSCIPTEAPHWSYEAGRRTAEYILKHRIPRPVQTVLRIAPAAVAARLLARAIKRNSWTFAGSGRFEAVDPWCLRIYDNPLVRGEESPQPLCRWHVAVFERLYAELVAPDCVCVETRCCAQRAHSCCEFRIRRTGIPPKDHA